MGTGTEPRRERELMAWLGVCNGDGCAAPRGSRGAASARDRWTKQGSDLDRASSVRDSPGDARVSRLAQPGAVADEQRRSRPSARGNRRDPRSRAVALRCEDLRCDAGARPRVWFDLELDPRQVVLPLRARTRISWFRRRRRVRTTARPRVARGAAATARFVCCGAVEPRRAEQEPEHQQRPEPHRAAHAFAHHDESIGRWGGKAVGDSLARTIDERPGDIVQRRCWQGEGRVRPGGGQPTGRGVGSDDRRCQKARARRFRGPAPADKAGA